MNHEYLETDWGKLSIRRFGTGEPLVAFHGWMDNGMTFANLSEESDRQWIAVDLPGHGFSDHLPDYSFPQWIAIVHAVLDALELQTPVDLVGHSMGGGISLVYAGVFPERVRSVVSLDALGPLTAPALGGKDRLRNAIEMRETLLPNRVSKSKSALIRARMAGLGYLSRDEATQLAEGAIAEVGEGFAFTHDPKLKTGSFLRFTEDHVVELLSAIECPVLVIRPEAGFPVEEDVMRHRLGLIPHHALAMVDGHHHAHMTSPDVFLKEIETFWSSNVPETKSER